MKKQNQTKIKIKIKTKNNKGNFIKNVLINGIK